MAAATLAALAVIPPHRCQSAIIPVGNGTGYDVTNNGNWDTPLPGVWGPWDIDGDNQLGSAGFFFFGAFDGTTNQNNQPWAAGNYVSNLPGFVTSVGPGSHFASIAWAFSSYGRIDHPIARDQSNVLAGIAVAPGSGQGSYAEILQFTIDQDYPVGQTIRVGVLGGIEGNADGRWQPTAFRLSDGSNVATVTGLANVAGQPSWVFFDIDRPGTYSLAGQQRLATQGATVGGLTFDVIPEPGSAMLLALAAVALLLRRRRR